MARNTQIHKLSALAIKSKKEPGYYSDGGCLYLRIAKAGTKTWALRYMIAGQSREMGMGSVNTVTLADARELASQYRKDLLQGIDPISKRQDTISQNLSSLKSRKLFKECSDLYIDQLVLKNAKQYQNWRNTMATYVHPYIGHKDVNAVTKLDVLHLTEAIWTTKNATAAIVLQRVKAVLEWTVAREYRADHNALMFDEIIKSLPKKRASAHHESCDYKAISSFIQAVHKDESRTPSTRAGIEFLILVVGRLNEMRGAEWPEFDLEAKIWTISPLRMKGNRPHRVPLSDRATEIIKGQIGKHPVLVFPSDHKENVPIGMATFEDIPNHLGYTFTLHGFRSTFRNWAADKTNYSTEVCEASISHKIAKNDTEASYLHTDLLEKRRPLMQEWTDYCKTVAPTAD